MPSTFQAYDVGICDDYDENTGIQRNLVDPLRGLAGCHFKKPLKDLGNMALFAQSLFIIELGDRTDFAGELRLNLALDFLRLVGYRMALLDSFSLRVDI